MPSTGRLNVASVPARITSDARGTPATPLLVSISVSIMTSCVPKGTMNARGLRDEHRRQRQIQRRAIQIEAVPGRQHKGDDMFRHAEAFHVFERQRQGGFARRGRKRDQRTARVRAR